MKTDFTKNELRIIWNCLTLEKHAQGFIRGFRKELTENEKSVINLITKVGKTIKK